MYTSLIIEYTPFDMSVTCSFFSMRYGQTFASSFYLIFPHPRHAINIPDDTQPYLLLYFRLQWTFIHHFHNLKSGAISITLMGYRNNTNRFILFYFKCRVTRRAPAPFVRRVDVEVFGNVRIRSGADLYKGPNIH